MQKSEAFLSLVQVSAEPGSRILPVSVIQPRSQMFPFWGAHVLISRTKLLGESCSKRYITPFRKASVGSGGSGGLILRHRPFCALCLVSNNETPGAALSVESGNGRIPLWYYRHQCGPSLAFGSQTQMLLPCPACNSSGLFDMTSFSPWLYDHPGARQARWLVLLFYLVRGCFSCWYIPMSNFVIGTHGNGGPAGTLAWVWVERRGCHRDRFTRQRGWGSSGTIQQAHAISRILGLIV